MTDSKKRLKEILKREIPYSPYDTNRESKNAKVVDNLSTEILKEFVHKDSLPSEEEIACPFCNEGGFDLIGLKHHLLTYCNEFNKIENL